LLENTTSNAMQVLLDIKDDKADFVMEVLKNFRFVKVKPLKTSKERFLEEFKDAVEEVKLIKAGQMKGRPAKELLDEL
jgi:hypothetical protein